MNNKEQILEGWKEIGHFLGRYSARHARRLFCPVRDQLKLKYWLGPGHRIKMLYEELEAFKTLIGKESSFHKQGENYEELERRRFESQVLPER